MTSRALNYGSYGTFPIMGNAGFISSTVCRLVGVGFPVISRPPVLDSALPASRLVAVCMGFRVEGFFRK